MDSGPRRRAQDAIGETRQFINHGYEWVIEGDVEDCFGGSIHQGPLDGAGAFSGQTDKRILGADPEGILGRRCHVRAWHRDRDAPIGTPQGAL